MNELHIGQQIKKVIELRGFTVTEFAKRINKSRENIYSIYTRKTIDTGLLEIISDVLAYDFFLSFSKTNEMLIEKNKRLEEENAMLKQLNSLLQEKSEK